MATAIRRITMAPVDDLQAGILSGLAGSQKVKKEPKLNLGIPTDCPRARRRPAAGRRTRRKGGPDSVDAKQQNLEGRTTKEALPALAVGLIGCASYYEKSSPEL
jgi:hypothetical protein